jgi:hypothetical protein
VTGKPALRAILGALACIPIACFLCGAAAAQGRYPPSHGGGGPEPRGGFGGMDPRGSPFGFPAPYGMAPPRYGQPPQPRADQEAPPRRPGDAPPGWRGAPREPPGITREPGAVHSRMASLDWVIESIQRRSPGRQLDANLGYVDGGRPVYVVRWLTQHGRRTDYIVDAQTGAILSGR